MSNKQEQQAWAFGYLGYYLMFYTLETRAFLFGEDGFGFHIFLDMIPTPTTTYNQAVGQAASPLGSGPNLRDKPQGILGHDSGMRHGHRKSKTWTDFSHFDILGTRYTFLTRRGLYTR